MLARLLAAAACACTLGWSAPPAAATVPKTSRPIAKPAVRAPQIPVLPPAARAAIERISPDSLRGNLSFLASDLLEGRNTPSRGLDIAADFIASRFRAAGLAPAPTADGYFQKAEWSYRQIPLQRAQVSFQSGSQQIRIDPSQLSVTSLEAVRAENAPVFKATTASAAGLHNMAEGALAGSIVLIETVSFDRMRKLSTDERSELMRKYSSANDALRRLKPAAVIGLRRDSGLGAGATAQLIDPKAEKRRPRPGSAIPNHIHSRELMAIYDSLPEGASQATMTFVLPEAEQRPVALKNVIGVLPGSDPVLRDSYIILTAHYDHVGLGGEEQGDAIYNGANDDASGTASILEAASALAAGTARPRRSIVFMALFGEEKGLLGSYYYTRNPVFPLEKTIANINLEHMGRTDDSEGPQVGKLSMTGFDYSDLGPIFQTAARQTGVDFYNREKQSDAFFNRSDNAAFAEAGIPAHTLTVSYEFPDYHALGDHWEKIDYANLALVNRTVVAALWTLANRSQAPQWNQKTDKTEKYRSVRAAEGNKTAQ